MSKSIANWSGGILAALVALFLLAHIGVSYGVGEIPAAAASLEEWLRGLGGWFW